MARMANRLLRTWGILLLALLAATWAVLPAGAEELDATEIVRRVVDNLRGGTLEGTYTVTVERPNRTTQYVMTVLSDGEDRGLIRVVQPPREAGQAFLIDGDDLWVYNPRLGRSLRLPPSGRNGAFLGSDISYNDLAGRDLEEDYTPSILASSGQTLTLELVPKPGAPTPYGQVRLEVEAERLVPQRIDYYDQRGNVVKRAELSEYTPVGDRWVPLRMAVQDVTRPGHRTEVRLSDARFGIELPAGSFTLQALERGGR